MQDSTHSIVNSAKRFFSGTLLSRISGMLRDVSMAYAFGTHEAVAAFLVAFRLSHLLRRLFGEGALQSAFIPQFESIRSQNSQTACRFFRDLYVWLTLGLTTIIFGSMGILAGCWFYGDLSSGNADIVFLALLLMPSLLFICLFGLNASLLQCEKSYFISGVAPVAFNVIWVIGALLLQNTPASHAMPWLAVCVIIACFSQWLMTVPQTMRILNQHDVPFYKNVKLFSSDLKNFCTPLFFGIIGVAATQINSALDAIFARYANEEGPALLWYALRIQQLPLALFGVAIAGALLPPLTRALKNQEKEKYLSFLQFAVRKTFALMIPLTAGLLIMGDTCVACLFGRGDFDAHSIVGTTRCLWGYSLGLVPMALVLVVAPAFYAQKDTFTPAKISFISVLTNVVLNAFFVFSLGLGEVSVAIATSISSWVNLAFLFYALSDRKEVLHPSIWAEVLKIVCACFIACAATIGITFYFSSVFLFTETFVSLFIKCVLQGSSFIVALLCCAKLLNIRDILEFLPTKKQQLSF